MEISIGIVFILPMKIFSAEHVFRYIAGVLGEMKMLFWRERERSSKFRFMIEFFLQNKTIKNTYCTRYRKTDWKPTSHRSFKFNRSSLSSTNLISSLITSFGRWYQSLHLVYFVDAFGVDSWQFKRQQN